MSEIKNSVQSISRTFDILETLSSYPGGLTLTELSKRLDLHKSTAYRLLAALRDRRYVEKQGTTYKLGLEFIHIASQFLNSLEIKTEAEPFLRELSQKTGQTVFLATRDRDEIIYIDKIEQFDSLRRYSIIGTRQPLYCTSLGRAFLMGETDHELEKSLEGMDLHPRTSKTITDLAKLKKMIISWRARGWSEDIEENQEGVSCTGAPIFDYRNKIIAAMSTVWDSRDGEIDPHTLGSLVKQTADSISERLGWIPAM